MITVLVCVVQVHGNGAINNNKGQEKYCIYKTLRKIDTYLSYRHIFNHKMAVL